ncbi:hypothetical protein ACIBFB_20280 [Nocardiopsis sp. NPDC050513]|uniref:hypothetical protein n=1 Tax=Nocardiopsis sp. NPDC050513 TaxID=3364338 RepID=UPI0037A06C7A
MREKKVYPATGALGLDPLIGCGGADPYSATDACASDPQQESSPAENGSEDSNAVEDVLNLTRRGHEALGELVTDAVGHTLYRFEQDSADPPEVTCFDDCAEIWPPALAMSDLDFSDGLDPSLFDSVERENRSVWAQRICASNPSGNGSERGARSASP